jgi:hypothetical protein
VNVDNPYSAEQTAFKERLAANATLATIPMFIEDLGDISTKLENALAGLKGGTTNKNGLSIGLLTPSGRSDNEDAPESENDTIRVSVWCKPLINGGTSGFQIHPLTVIYLIRKQLATWDRGPGNKPPKFLTWDSVEDTARGIVNYFADFETFQLIELE